MPLFAAKEADNPSQEQRPEYKLQAMGRMMDVDESNAGSALFSACLEEHGDVIQAVMLCVTQGLEATQASKDFEYKNWLILLCSFNIFYMQVRYCHQPLRCGLLEFEPAAPSPVKSPSHTSFDTLVPHTGWIRYAMRRECET